jgi:uncharacterized repeat protein (TIGR02543 family)
VAEQAADAFREIETVKEALKINAPAIDLDVPADELIALEAKIDEALAAYDELSQGARSALSAEKARLDAVKEKIGHVYSAHDFRDDHTVTLAKNPEELTTPEAAEDLLPELNEALEAYEALPEGAQELLAEDIALLEDLKEKAEELTAPPLPPDQHTIAFDSHGGSKVEAITENEGTAVPRPADPARTGYGFEGWFNAASGGTERSWPHELTESITVHAQWTAIAYTVQYNPNGGTGTMTPSAHTYDTAKDLSGNGFARSGYSFKEWAAAPNGSGAVYADKASVVNLSSTNGAAIDLYAQWTAISYAIDYNLNGGDNGDNPAAYTVEDLPLALHDPSRSGYSFQGWHDNGGFNGNPITAIPGGSTEAKTFHARWTLDTYTIRYELYGGDNDPGNPKTYTVESPALALADPTHPGRQFAGWHWNAAFAGNAVTEIPAGSAGAITLHAHWKLPAIIAIHLQSASEPSLAGTTTLPMNQPATFTVASDSGIAAVAWFWNGEPIAGETAASYTRPGYLMRQPGIYELSVVATDGSGERLSARRRVVITTEQGGAE